MNNARQNYRQNPIKAASRAGDNLGLTLQSYLPREFAQ